MRIPSVVAASLLLVTLVACSSSTPSAPTAVADAMAPTVGGTPISGRSSLPTIVGIASSNADFSTLVQAVVKAGLVETLNGNRHYTVFAPTNAAFDALAQAKGLANGSALVAALDPATLAAVLRYHVTLGDRNSTSVLSAGSLTMLDGNVASISVQNGAAYIQNAKIIATDIRASNGIVHVLDAVILPPQ